MDDIIITQKQIEELLNAIPLGEKINFEIEALLGILDRVLTDNPNRATYTFKKRVQRFQLLFKEREQRRNHDFRIEYKPILEIILRNEESLEMLKTAGKIENLLSIYYNGFDSQKMMKEKTPLTLEAAVRSGDELHTAMLFDISTYGVSFFSEQTFAENEACKISFSTSEHYLFDIVAKKIYPNKFPSRFPYIVGAEFKDPLNSSQLRDIITFAYNGGRKG